MSFSSVKGNFGFIQNTKVSQNEVGSDAVETEKKIPDNKCEQITGTLINQRDIHQLPNVVLLEKEDCLYAEDVLVSYKGCLIDNIQYKYICLPLNKYCNESAVLVSFFDENMKSVDPTLESTIGNTFRKKRGVIVKDRFDKQKKFFH